MKKSVLLLATLSALSGAAGAGSTAPAASRPPTFERPDRGPGRLNLPQPCFSARASLGTMMACRHVAVKSLAQQRAPMHSRVNPKPTSAPNEFWSMQLAHEGTTYHYVVASKVTFLPQSPAFLLRNALKKLEKRIDNKLVTLTCAEKSRAEKDALVIDQNLMPTSLTGPLLRVPCH